MATIDVTIVVCTYNRAAMLRDTLASLVALATDNLFSYEVLVVDNASTDETPLVIRGVASRAPVLVRDAREGQPGVASARNRGIQEAAGEWIAFFDDDQVADPAWLKELLALAHAKEARCVGGANRLRLPAGLEELLPAEVRQLHSESQNWPNPCRYSRRAAPGTGNLLVHRSVFEQVGVFDETLRQGGEDGDLFRRLCGAKIDAWHAPKAISYHVIPAYRLQPAYLRWKMLRNGGHLARRNWQEWSRVMFLFVLLARLGQAAAVYLPRLCWARLFGGPGRALAARCPWWRAEGYIRFALYFLAPRWFEQRAFFSWLEFRSERELFAAAG
jgi:glycosyltransferase involved in cell wall biosynthesis